MSVKQTLNMLYNEVEYSGVIKMNIKEIETLVDKLPNKMEKKAILKETQCDSGCPPIKLDARIEEIYIMKKQRGFNPNELILPEQGAGKINELIYPKKRPSN
jgi:hypothetical protein